jgi:hypothetical protein
LLAPTDQGEGHGVEQCRLKQQRAPHRREASQGEPPLPGDGGQHDGSNPDPTRDQQIDVAKEIFGHVREMYDTLDAKGRRGVIKALREGIGNRTEQKVPAEQSR